MSSDYPQSPPQSIDWRELAKETAGILRECGVDTAWWNGREPFPNFFLDLMRSARRDLPAAEATKSSDPEWSSQLAELYPHARNIMETLLGELALGDEELNYDPAKALKHFRNAAESARSPGLQLELGGLMLHRARAQPPPLMEFDFEGLAPYPWDFQDLWPVLGREVAPGPKADNPAPLIDLALDLCGRATVHILEQIGEQPSLNEFETEHDAVDRWRVYLGLEGLKCALLHQSDSEDALKHICRLYSSWHAHEGWFLAGDPERQDNPFTSGFEYLRGYLDGKDASEAVDAASLMTDPILLLRDIQSDIKELKATRTPTEAEIAEMLHQRFGDDWRSVPEFVKEPLIAADHKMAFYRSGDRPDYGAVVVEYAKAVEYLCSALETSPSNSVLGRFGNRDSSPLRRMLAAGAPKDRIINDIRTLSSSRNAWVHRDRRTGASRRVSLSLCESLRESALCVIHDIVRWRK